VLFKRDVGPCSTAVAASTLSASTRAFASSEAALVLQCLRWSDYVREGVELGEEALLHASDRLALQLDRRKVAFASVRRAECR
jgi:hypothetical protein